MRNNRLRDLLNADQPTLGTRILSSWPTIMELDGHSGMFDYVEFCGGCGIASRPLRPGAMLHACVGMLKWLFKQTGLFLFIENCKFRYGCPIDE
jgi:hypothetical protein